jgi:heat shock protein beta
VRRYAAATKEEFKDFIKWWKDVLPSDDVEAVKISNRLVTTPVSVVTSKYGWSANMERIMKAQALSDDSRMGYMKGKKTLEINPRHPIIKALKEKATEDPESEEVKTIAKVMFETAMLESGFTFDQPQEFAGRLFELVSNSMGVPADAAIEEEAPEEEEEAEEEAAEEATEEKDEL